MQLPSLVIPAGTSTLRLLPIFIVGGGFVLTMLLDTFIDRRYRSWLAAFGAVILLAAGVTIVLQWVNLGAHSYQVYAGSFAYDRFGLFIDGLVVLAALGTMGISPRYLQQQDIHHGEFYSLLLAATTGMMLVGSADSLMMIFLSVEILSLALYLLSGFKRDEERSQEAAFKYFVLGGFASAIMLFGMAFVFGETGHTQLSDISAVLDISNRGPDPMLLIGVISIFVGMAFKVSAAPFHMWTPDVYQGAPVAVTTFMSVATKVAAFAAILRLYDATFLSVYTHWEVIVAAVAILSMILGNVVALMQTSVKRMIAYSGIAQAGYILIGVAVGGQHATTAVLVYLASYTLSNFGVLAGLTMLSGKEGDRDTYASIRGVAEKHPAIAATMSLFLLSLAGFPPLVGFWGKFFVFTTALGNGQSGLALWGIATSAVSVFYYLRVIVLMYSVPVLEDEKKPSHLGIPSRWGGVVLGVGVVSTVVMGIAIPTLYTLASDAGSALLMHFNL